MNVKTLVKENKKPIAISLLALVLMLFIAFGIFAVSHNDKSNQSTNEILSVYSSKTVFEKFQQELASWSADYRIQACQAEPISSLEIEGEIKKFVGFEEGKFASWNCNVFSPGKKQILTILWSKGEVELSKPITMNDSFISLAESKPYFNELGDVIDSEDIYDQFEENADENSNYYTFAIGEDTISQFNDRYVWKVSIYSKEDKNENGQNQVLNEIYFDAKTGQAL